MHSDDLSWLIQNPLLSFCGTLRNRLRDVIFVTDFGALGDGVTNDSAAIQRAISHAYSRHIDNYDPPGATPSTAQNAVPSVFFPTGVYLVKDPIDIGGNKALSLVGDSKAVVVGGGSQPTNPFLTGTHCRNLLVSGMHFENFMARRNKSVTVELDSNAVIR